MADEQGGASPPPSPPGDAAGLRITWSPAYRTAWDDTPEAYLAHGVVAWGRSRRLARFEDARYAFKGYLGVQHADPARWHAAGEPRTVWFVSLFLLGRTITLRTFPTLAGAL
ncbi:MAG TPA: hypothetical protein VGR57_16500, partial [Ktedonobacterales bacterium]|nr:hypothetical protein [Ktedonobacterales bacterium]